MSCIKKSSNFQVVKKSENMYMCKLADSYMDGYTRV